MIWTNEYVLCVNMDRLRERRIVRGETGSRVFVSQRMDHVFVNGCVAEVSLFVGL